MSIFHTVSLSCPHCAQAVAFEACDSVNADRRPDLRAAILDGSFQRMACPHCAKSFRAAPQLTYLDVGRGQWIAAFPPEAVDQWVELEAAATRAYDQAFGSGASVDAREIGQTLKPRVVFGWHGLTEKLVAAEAGLDDVTLELTKMALLRGLDDPPLPIGTQLRLLADVPDEQSLLLTTVPARPPVDADEDSGAEELQVPRSLYDEIVAEADDWAALRGRVGAGLFVDVMRLTHGAP